MVQHPKHSSTGNTEESKKCICLSLLNSLAEACSIKSLSCGGCSWLDQIRNNDLNEWVMAWETTLIIKTQNSDRTLKVLLLSSHLTSNWFQNKQKIDFSLINDFILKIGMGNSIRLITCSLRAVMTMESYMNSRKFWNKPASTNTLWK